MKTLKIAIFLTMVTLSISSIAQEKIDTFSEIDKFQFGISASDLSYSWFYGDRNQTNYSPWNSDLFDLNLDIVCFYHIKKDYFISSQLI